MAAVCYVRNTSIAGVPPEATVGAVSALGLNRSRGRGGKRAERARK